MRRFYMLDYSEAEHKERKTLVTEQQTSLRIPENVPGISVNRLLYDDRFTSCMDISIFPTSAIGFMASRVRD